MAWARWEPPPSSNLSLQIRWQVVRKETLGHTGEDSKTSPIRLGCQVRLSHLRSLSCNRCATIMLAHLSKMTSQSMQWGHPSTTRQSQTTHRASLSQPSKTSAAADMTLEQTCTARLGIILEVNSHAAQAVAQRSHLRASYGDAARTVTLNSAIIVALEGESKELYWLS